MRLKDAAVEFVISKDTPGTTIMCGEYFHCGTSRLKAICKDDEEMVVIVKNAKAKFIRLDSCKLFYWLADWDGPPKETRLLKAFDVTKLDTLADDLLATVRRQQRGEPLAAPEVVATHVFTPEATPQTVVVDIEITAVTPEPTPAVVVVEAPVLDVVLETPAPVVEQAPEVKEGIIESRFNKRDKKKNRHQTSQTDDTVTE